MIDCCLSTPRLIKYIQIVWWKTHFPQPQSICFITRVHELRGLRVPPPKSFVTLQHIYIMPRSENIYRITISNSAPRAAYIRALSTLYEHREPYAVLYNQGSRTHATLDEFFLLLSFNRVESLRNTRGACVPYGCCFNYTSNNRCGDQDKQWTRIVCNSSMKSNLSLSICFTSPKTIIGMLLLLQSLSAM